MRLTVLGSGSTGNAILIVAGGTHVLVDAGLSAREIARRLMLVGCDPARLDGVILTHEHGDHAGGLRVLLKNLRCPVYITGETREAYVSERRGVSSDEPRKRLEALRERVETISSSRDFCIGQLDFHPFTVPHDAADHFGLNVAYAGVRIGVVLDCGHITTLVRERLKGCAAIIIESNHDPDMLKACPVYPWELKQRILSRTGHLSNEAVAEWLRDDFDGTASHIVLAHLSQRANNPHLARISAEMALRARNSIFQPQTEIVISSAKEPTPWIEL